MIHFDEKTQVFNLVGKASVYACRIDATGRLTHLGWSPLLGASSSAPVTGSLPEDPLAMMGLDRQGERDEVLTFGDHAYREVTLKVSYPSAPPSLQAGETAHEPVRDVRLRYVNHEIVTDAVPGLSPVHGRPTAVTTPRETLRIQLDDPVQPLTVYACFRVTPEHDIIERWLELENRSSKPVEIEQCFFGSVHVPNGQWDLMHTTGEWGTEFTTECLPLATGTTVLESRTIRTGFGHNPFFLLGPSGGASEESGLIYFGQLAFSGNWQLSLEKRSNAAVIVHGGYNTFDFGMTLEGKGRHVTPAFLHGCCRDGWGGASRRMHAFIRERVIPVPDPEREVRPVLYNSWEATYFDLSTEGQIDLARKAADVGVELFCMDDGWFGGRRHDGAGLGDWTVSKDVFPEGLQPLIDEVHRLGMRFGLWVEPEMVNPDSDLYREHPDWVLHFPGRPRTEERNQLLLDFGRREVVEHIYGVLVALLDEYEIDFFKWDMNRSATEPGSVVGQEIWRAHTAGVYEIMDRLRAAHPELAIESCSSGGGRIDAGILARTDQFWTSDNTDALDRIRIQEGCSLAFPARTMACWVTHAKNHQTGRRLSLQTRFEVAMRGVLGIGSNLAELDDTELETYRKYIAFYKRVRHVIQHGDCYRLQRLGDAGTSIVQYVLPDQSAAVVSTVIHDRPIANTVAPARLSGLDPTATYLAEDTDGDEQWRASGAELMSIGLEPNLGLGWYTAGYSRTLFIQRV